MKTLAVLAAVVVLLATVLSVLPLHGEEAIYDSVIRLHVLAESDSGEDQADRLAVRDAILPIAAEKLADCENRDSAAQRLEELLPTLEQTAQEVLRERGTDAPVTVTLGQEE
jgi:stage II sporulation protein R